MTATAPDVAAARDHVVREVVRLARALRRDGAAVPADAAIPAARSLAEVGLDDRDRVRAALRATLVTDAGDRPAFEAAFPDFWDRLKSGIASSAARDGTDGLADDERGGTDADGEPVDLAPDATPDAGLDGAGRSTEAGSVRSRRVAGTDAAETVDDNGRAGAYSAVGERSAVGDDATDGEPVGSATMRRFERALATLAGRRWVAGAGGQSVDARRALRESVSTGGVAVSVPTRERRRSAFRTCVLVDVSRSVLDSIDRRFLLSVLAALVADGRSTRAFFFDTEIRDVTEAFAGSDGDPAAVLERAEVAWGGGTRIGGSVAALRRRWPDAVDRRTVTLVVSDGLEVGEIDELESSAAWLARRSRAVVWLNPLAASPAWEPTCRGMEAVEPYVDALFAFGGDADLDDAARQLSRRGPSGPVGYEHDFRDRTGEGGVATE